MREALYSEMEMMVPLPALPAALAAFVARLDDPAVRAQHDAAAASLYVLVRLVGGDDIPLSPFYGRDTAVLSMIVFGPPGVQGVSGPPGETAYFTGLLQETCIASAGATVVRPHPGKINSFTVPMMAVAYADTYAAFTALRSRVDPARLFANDYTDRLFGVY